MLAAGVHARPKRRRLLTATVAGTLVLALTLLALARPATYNWDMLAYAAIALKEGDAVARHTALWDFVERDVPARQAAVLRGQPVADPAAYSYRRADTIKYRRAVAADPHALSEQLPFYSVKPLYPALITLAMTLTAVVGGPAADATGIGPVHASVLIAKLSWVCFGVTLFLLLRLRFSNVVAAVCTFAGMALPIPRELVGHSSPDALSAMLILLTFVLALRDPSRKWTLAATGVGLLSIAARPDNLLLLGLLLCWFLWNRRIRFRSALLAGGLALAWYLVLARLSNNYGWAVLVHHSFIDFAEYPSQLQTHLSPGMLLDLYLSKLRSSFSFFQFMAFGILVAFARWRRRGAGDQLLQALLVMLLFMAAHWVIFPDEKDRLLVAPYLFILASGSFVLADWWADMARRGRHVPINR